MAFSGARNFVIHDSTFIEVHRNHSTAPREPRLQRRHWSDLTTNLYGIEFDSARRQPAPKCYPGTRTALLTSIDQWVYRGPAHGRILWLHGPAGAGKSAIAQTLAERYHSRGELAASLFLHRNIQSSDGSGNDIGVASRIISSISYQMKQLPGMRELILKAEDDNTDILEKSFNPQLEKLIIEPCMAAERYGASGSPLCVILDSLDDCGDELLEAEIIQLLQTVLPVHPVPLRFIITTRPERRIRWAFAQQLLLPHPSSVVVEFALENFPADGCIALYLTQGFKAVQEKHHDVMGPFRGSTTSSWPGKDIIDALVLKASGQFVFASTVLKYIDDAYSRPDEKLNTILGIQPAVGSAAIAFSDLDKLYHKVLSTHPNTPFMLYILGIIITLRAALTPNEIEELLSLKDGDVYLSLRGLHAVLVIPEPVEDVFFVWRQREVRVWHASFEDFLLDETRSGRFFINRRTSHTKLTLHCIRVMLQWGVWGARMANVSHCYMPEPEELRYASENMAFHLLNSGHDALLLDEIRKFSLSSWTQGASWRSVRSEKYLQILAVIIPWLESAEEPLNDLVDRFREEERSIREGILDVRSAGKNSRNQDWLQ